MAKAKHPGRQVRGRVKGIEETQPVRRNTIKEATKYRAAAAEWSAIVKEPVLSEFDYITISQKGLTKKTIDELASALGISRKSMAEDVFDISVKTMERKDPKDPFDKRISSHAVEIAKLWQHASEVFVQEERARQWINRPNEALNNNKPVDLLDTLTGINMINDVLVRIEEGVYT